MYSGTITRICLRLVLTMSIMGTAGCTTNRTVMPLEGYLIGCGGRGIDVIDLASGRSTTLLPYGRVDFWVPTYDDKANTLFFVAEDGNGWAIYAWHNDATHPSVLCRLPEVVSNPDYHLYRMALSPCGKSLFVVIRERGSPGSMIRVDSESGELKEIVKDHIDKDFLVTSDGRILVMRTAPPPTTHFSILEIDPDNGSSKKLFELREKAIPTFSLSGRQALVPCCEGYNLYDMKTGEAVKKLPFDFPYQEGSGRPLFINDDIVVQYRSRHHMAGYGIMMMDIRTGETWRFSRQYMEGMTFLPRQPEWTPRKVPPRWAVDPQAITLWIGPDRRICIQPPPGAKPTEHVREKGRLHLLFWDKLPLIGPDYERTVLEKLKPDEVLFIEVFRDYRSFVDGLLTCITLGVYSPRTIEFEGQIYSVEGAENAR
jgi:hypothetical protein